MSTGNTRGDAGAEAAERLRAALRRPGILDDVLADLEAAVVVLDATARLVTCNRFFERLSGYDQEDLRGRSWFDLLAVGDDESPDDEPWRRALAGEDPRGALGEIRTRHGTGRRLLWSGRVLEDGGEVVGILAIGHDFTDMAAANQALSRSEARMAAIVETAGEGIVTIDESGEIHTFNRAAERMFGWRADEVIGENVSMLMPAPYRDEHDGYLGRYLRTGEKRIIGIGREVVGVRRDGASFPMHLGVSEIGDLRPRMFTGIVRDLSEREKLERHLERIAAEERHRVALDLHDDLGGRMTGVSILASLLQRRLESAGSPEAPRAAELADHIQQAHEQVRRISRGLLPVEPDPLGLTVALRETARRTREVHGIRCAFECPVALEVHDHAAANHLYRLVAEAVENAVRHAQPSEVRIAIAVEDGRAVLQIEDDGVGLPQQPGDGPGMGLRTMKYRAGLLGASFAARRQDDGGTVVRCTVPLERLGGVAC